MTRIDSTPLRPTLVGFAGLATVVLACAIVNLHDTGGIDHALTGYFLLLGLLAKNVAEGSGSRGVVRVNLLAFCGVATLMASVALFVLPEANADAALSGYNVLMAALANQAAGSGDDAA